MSSILHSLLVALCVDGLLNKFLCWDNILEHREYGQGVESFLACDIFFFYVSMVLSINSSHMVLRTQVLILFNVLKRRSLSAVETGVVRIILHNFVVSGKFSSRSKTSSSIIVIGHWLSVVWPVQSTKLLPDRSYIFVSLLTTGHLSAHFTVTEPVSTIPIASTNTITIHCISISSANHKSLQDWWH